MHRSYSSAVLPTTATPSAAAGRTEFNPSSFEIALKRYLYDKYVGRNANGGPAVGAIEE
jgi:hypothetical protein